MASDPYVRRIEAAVAYVEQVIAQRVDHLRMMGKTTEEIVPLVQHLSHERNGLLAILTSSLTPDAKLVG